jgi:hypothetical protein
MYGWDAQGWDKQACFFTENVGRKKRKKVK